MYIPLPRLKSGDRWFYVHDLMVMTTHLPDQYSKKCQKELNKNKRQHFPVHPSFRILVLYIFLFHERIREIGSEENRTLKEVRLTLNTTWWKPTWSSMPMWKFVKLGCYINLIPESFIFDPIVSSCRTNLASKSSHFRSN